MPTDAHLIRFAKTPDGVRIAYSSIGSGRALVLVRGWFGHLERMWDMPEVRAYYESLAARMRVVTFDARGNGLSDRRPDELSVDTLTADLETVVDALDLTGVVLYGIGYGGPIAIEYAARHPERVAALVLFGTRARPEGADYSAFISAVEKVPGGTRLIAWNSHPDDPVRAEQSARFLRDAVDRRTAGRFYKLAETFDVSARLEDVGAPALVMHPRHSKVPFVLGRELAATLPNARFVELDGSDWNPWFVEPDRTLALVGDFLVDCGLLQADALPAREDTARPVPEYAFHREGEYWTVAFEGRAVRLRDAKGLRYIARLIAQPGHELHVGQLAGLTEASPSGHAGELLDQASRRAYEYRIEELREEIEDARRWDDADRESRAREELDTIARQLAAAFGIGGRARHASDAAERMRKATTNRIKDSLAKIRKEHPPLGAHLDAAVRTGSFCAYDPADRVSWTL